MMAENLLAVSAFDLVFGGLEAVFGQTENGVVILSLSS
jgi:hypothetical protein